MTVAWASQEIIPTLTNLRRLSPHPLRLLQAIDCFLANASKHEHDITVELDRYIVWRGQALATKSAT